MIVTNSFPEEEYAMLTKAARQLGLSLSDLNHMVYGHHPVIDPTGQPILDFYEKHGTKPAAE